MLQQHCDDYIVVGGTTSDKDVDDIINLELEIDNFVQAIGV